MIKRSTILAAVSLAVMISCQALAQSTDGGTVTGVVTAKTTGPTGTSVVETTTVASGPAAEQAQAAADKAKADLRTSQAQAKSAEIAAANAVLPTSGTSGAITLQAGAGTEEANALAAVALNDAAQRITTKLTAAHDTGAFLIVAGSTMPDFSGWVTFDARLTFLKNQLDEAQTAYATAEAMPPVATSKKDFTGIGEAISSLVKLAQLAATDWSASGMNLTADDYMLAVAVASRNDHATIYNQSNSIDSYNALTGRLGDVDALRGKAALNAVAAAADSAALKAQAKKNKAAADTMNDKAAALDAAVTKLNAAVAAYDAFLGQLTGSASSGSGSATAASTSPTLGVILQQKIAYDTAQSAGVLFLKVHSASGGLITKKNLWSAFGAMPFYASGGTVVSFSFVKQNARLSGLLPVVTPYNKVIYTRDIVNSDNDGLCDAKPASGAALAKYHRYCPGG